MRDPARAARAAQEAFRGKAGAYRASPSHGAQEDLDRMLRWLQPARGARALDLGTGGGHTAAALAAAGCGVVAVDVTPDMVRALRAPGGALPRADAALADAHALPFRGGGFDVVASRIAAHHFADLPAALGEAARVLRPGGWLYAFDLTAPEDPRQAARIHEVEALRDPSHVRSHPPSAWRAALRAAGLEVQRLETGVSLLDLEAWVARAALPAPDEARLRALLRALGPDAAGGFGVQPDGRMRVLRVEVLARRAG